MAAGGEVNSQQTKRSVYFAMRDVLLDAPAFWRLDDTAVFGFYPRPGVNAVIPWKKLGLYLDPVLGKFNLVGSKIYESKMGGAGGVRRGARAAVVLKPDEHRFILALDKGTGRWYMAVPENSVVKVEHWPAYTKETHQCARVPAPVAVELEERSRCFLQNGDIVKIKWSIHPCVARGPEELRFAFYEKADSVGVPPPPPLFNLPTTVLEDIFSHFTAKEFLETVGSAVPCLPRDLQKVVPWKRIYLRFNFDSLRVVRLASPAAVETLKATVAPPTGILSAAPNREEFQERFHRLFIGHNLNSLYVWDTAFLVGAPAPPKLKNFKLCLLGRGSPTKSLASLTSSPVERLELASAFRIVGREVMDALPQLTKIVASFFPQLQFWSSMRREQLLRITHFSIDLRGSDWKEVPFSSMKNLRVLLISEMIPKDAVLLSLGSQPHLHTLAANFVCSGILSMGSSFWNSFASLAPNLEHLKLTWETFDKMDWVSFSSTLRNLKTLVLVGRAVSLRGIRDMANFFPEIRYMRVQTKNILREDLPEDPFLRLMNRGSLSPIWKPGRWYNRWDLSFVFVAYSVEEPEKVEDVFRF